LKLKNSFDFPLSIGKLDLTYTGPTSDACGEFPVPINTTLAGGATIEVPLFNGQIPPTTPTGNYSLAFDVRDPSGLNLGGGRAVLTISKVQAAVTAPANDCLNRTTGQPAPPTACANEFDIVAYHATADSLTNDFHGRLELRAGVTTGFLAPGQRSKSW